MYILSKKDAFKFILPPLTACLLFAFTLFGVVLPLTREHLLEQKKEAIATLIQTAVETLDYYAGLVSAGQLTSEAARAMALQHFRTLRYGKDGKDYFWINDLEPRMIMHPYRQDLEGENLADYEDPARKRLFVEFVDVVNRQGSGFVPYLWQWKDDTEKIVPKLSYVSLYKPWGWIIGTGVYLDEIQHEFSLMSRKLVLISLAILFLIGSLSLIIIRQGIREYGKRRDAEQELERQNALLEETVRLRTASLEEALSQVKQLSGFLPICASCKKIRDDKGYWNQIESYIREHSEAEFSHSICPECAAELYPRFIGGKAPNKE
ncbi:MAG: hypothetical protein Kow0089_13280 [Desulfobulbaceae bacterium]